MTLDAFLANAAAELEAVRAERDRLRLTLTGTRAALDLVQEECDDANVALNAVRQQLVEAGEMRRELSRRMGFEVAAKVAAEGALVSMIGTGKVGECTVTRHPDGHMTLAWDPEDADLVMASRELVESLYADVDDMRAALAESEARGDEWSRVAHQWAMQRDDARRRAEEAERVIAAYRAFPLRGPVETGGYVLGGADA